MIKHNNYITHLKNLEDFIRIFNESNSSDEFTLNCAMNGKAPFATKKFFDTQSFALLFKAIVPRKMLKYKIYLKENLNKLNEFYKDFILEDV